MITVTFQCNDVAALRADLNLFLNTLSTSDNRTTPVAPHQAAGVISEVDENQEEFDLKVPEKTEKKTRKPRAKKADVENNLAEGTKVKDHDVSPDEFDEPLTSVAGNMMLGQAAATPDVVRQAPGKPTREAVHAALQLVNSSCGLPVAREILSHFKAARISELKEEFYQSFIDKCQEAVMQA
jgi:hypothetical protein